ncbi:MAG: hypothetical protein J7M01_01510 [Candidatus Marinimicrobia bacterium]|nr:hypothetical protein [Candidatus Neomarinimicrobiota bacterium]
MKISAVIIFVLILLSGCVNTPRHFKSAGFESKSEAQKYIHDYLYYANKLTDKEWYAFYQRFPEYWKDIQHAKVIGSSIDYHPWYTAYSFKWNSDKRKQNWDASTLNRLSHKELIVGDDIFQVVNALGVPDRIIYDNDFEILIYKSNFAIIFENNVFLKKQTCIGCSKSFDHTTEDGMSENNIIQTRGLSRPKY